MALRLFHFNKRLCLTPKNSTAKGGNLTMLKGHHHLFIYLFVHFLHRTKSAVFHQEYTYMHKVSKITPVTINNTEACNGSME